MHSDVYFLYGILKGPFHGVNLELCLKSEIPKLPV